ncbi:MAG: cytochrome ubiquinol oxidase subunit I [Nitrospirales bacterium]|nr:cytochrome ubiquinol oxidase subunit I [Nitrospirales bacterium]
MLVWMKRAGFVCLLMSLGVVLAGELFKKAPAYAESSSNYYSDSPASSDIFYKTEGTPSGPSAQEMQTTYPVFQFINNRVLVWLVTQQHTYFGGFVLALPFFAVLLEFLGLCRRDPESARRYDGLARDIIRVSVVSLSFTALLGVTLVAVFVVLYPGFMKYMGSTFKSLMPLYAGVFVGVSSLLVVYYYSWDYLRSSGKKWVHMSIGVLVNAMGAVLLLSANAWASFMMAPSGVDGDGRFLGNVWHLLHSPLWNPLNTHRFLADIMSGGAVVVAYAAYRFLTTRSEKERAYYDWVGYVFILVVVCALLPMPIAGYWLMKAVFEFRAQMGITMMGGLLSWMFVIQAITVGVLFLGVNYYIWQSLGRVSGSERFHPYFKAIIFALMGCFIVWFTPHTIAMTPSEMKAMGAAQHPVIGQFGVMSAKNGAINIMICLTALSYLLYRRANHIVTVSWERVGNIALGAMFGLGMINIVWLAIYGFYIPANVRVGLSMPQGVTTATVVIGGLFLNYVMLRGSKVRGPIAWGNISIRGMVALFGVAAAFTWVMGLMGYIRSAGRLGWHVNELMQDVSPWSFTPAIGFAAKMVTVNMLLFWASVFCMFWLSRRDYQTADERIESRMTASTPLVQSLSREETSV